MSEELKIVLEDVGKKFDTVIEGIHMINEKLDRHIEDNKREFEQVNGAILRVEADVSVLKKDVATLKTDVAVLKTDVAILKTDVTEIRQDLNEHRNNTELHGQRKEKAS